eukprot:15439497-Alexandrium_andersonii.AAC.1
MCPALTWGRDRSFNARALTGLGSPHDEAGRGAGVPCLAPWDGAGSSTAPSGTHVCAVGAPCGR